MTTSLLVTLIVVFVVSILGIVAFGSILQPDERTLPSVLNHAASAADERDSLLP